MSEPTISVVIPTYNRASQLKRALAAVFAQTHAPAEIIVVDDHSSDATPEIFSNLADGRVVYIRQPTNRGASAARNVGISRATGTFIAFLDSDDEWLPTKLEKQVAIARGGDAGAIYCGVAFVDRHGRARQLHRPRHKGWILDSVLRDNVVGPTSAVMVRRALFEHVAGFDEALPASQDWDLWIRLARTAQFDFVDEYLVRNDIGSGARITDNPARRLAAGRLVYQKHIAPLGGAKPRIEANHCYRLGFAASMCGEGMEARRQFRRAVALEPANPRFWTAFMLSALGNAAFRLSHHGLTGVRRLVRRT